MTPSKLVVKERQSLFALHASSLSLLELAYLDFYNFVRDAATATFAPLKAARDAFNVAFNSVGPLSDNSHFSSFNYSVNPGLDTAINGGVTSSLMSLGMSFIGDFTIVANSLKNSFQSLPTSVITTATNVNYPSMTGLSDACVSKLFKDVKAVYSKYVTIAANTIKNATAQVKKLQLDVSADVTSLVSQLTTLNSQIIACNSNEACLEDLVSILTQQFLH